MGRPGLDPGTLRLKGPFVYPRLLLSDAVHTTAIGEDRASVSPLQATTRVELGEKFQGDVIVRIVEDSDDDESVADIVVDVGKVGPVAIDF